MIVFYYSIEVMATFLESFMCFYFENIIFDNTKLKKQIWLFAIFIAVIITILNLFDVNVIVTLMLAFTLLTITECLALRVKFADVITVTGIYFIFLNLFDAFSMSVLGTILSDPEFVKYVENGYSMHRVVFILFSKSLLLLFCFLARYYARVFYKTVKVKGVLIIVVIGIISSAYLMNLTVGAVNISIVLNWGLLCFVLCAICYIAFIVICYREEKNNRSFIEFHNVAITERYNEMLKKYQCNSIEFHDMKKHLAVLRKLIENNEAIRAKEYIDELTDTQDPSVNIWTGNEIMDCILNMEKQKAGECGIEFMIDADIIRYKKLSDKNLCAILTNLLDNAIEANAKISEGKKYVRVAIRQINDMLMIKIINAAVNSPKRFAKMLITTKTDKGRHGWGLKSVTVAVEESGGMLTYTFEEDSFTINVTFF